MKRLLYLLPIILLASCAGNPYKDIENTLKAKVFDAAGDMPLKRYKTESITFIDTVTVEERLAEIESELEPFYVKKDRKDFTKKRNQEFKEFRLDPSYERDVLRGKLKDASPWCTEIRLITEKADSLLNNWDKVSPYDYDYMYLNIWYLNRALHFYGTPSRYAIEALLEDLPNHKKAADQYKALSSTPKNWIVYYKVKYVYSFFNPIIKTNVRVSRIATYSGKMNFVEMDEGEFEFI